MHLVGDCADQLRGRGVGDGLQVVSQPLKRIEAAFGISGLNNAVGDDKQRITGL